jgi:hypothetical protein
MICIPSFRKISSAIQNLIRGDSQRHRQHKDRLSLLSFFFKIRKIGQADMKYIGRNTQVYNYHNVASYILA